MLRTHKLGEADRIITLLTRENGRVRAVAKGVRRTTSKFGSRLEPFTHVEVQLAEGRNLDTITQAETHDAFAAPLGADYERYTAGTVMLETAERLVTEEKQPSTQQFLLLVGGLRAMVGGERAARPGARLLPAPLAGRGRLRAVVRRAAPAAASAHASAGPAPLVQPVVRRDALHHLPGARLGRPGAGDGHVLGALLAGDWPAVEAADPRHLKEASGLVAAFLAWHIERGLRSLAYVGTTEAQRPSGSRHRIPRGRVRRSSQGQLVPRHVAIVMDGNGRWAKQQGLPRTKGHEAGESSLFDVVEGAIEIGVKAISAYAFSTENWTRSPDEVRFLMGFNRDVIRRRRDEMHELGVKVRWAGRAPRLWRSVIKELQVAEELTRDNDVLTLTMCVNYGGRAELADTMRSIAREVAAGRLNPDKIDERTDRPAPLRARAGRRRHGLADVGGAAAVQLHALAGGVQRAGVQRRPVARRRPAAPLGRDRGVRRPQPPLRESLISARAGEVALPVFSLVRARLREELRRLWLEPGDPRLLQLGFSLLFLLDMALRVGEMSSCAPGR